MTNPTFERLRARLAEIHDLRSATALLYWDQQTIMPPAGAAGRAEQIATLSRMTHELFVADETGALLEELRGYEESLDPDSFEASLVRVTRRDYEKSVRVPDGLLDDYEEGMKTDEVRRIFDELKEELVPLIAASRGREVDPLPGEFDVDAQREISLDVL